VKVLVAVALPGRQEVLELDLPEGSRVCDALAAAALGERFPALEIAQLRTGIWSQPCGLQEALRDGDRVELYRPLVADAKQMRRTRARARTPRR
jgi:putative ubiquitin-RnfH superfamily antitoxin RatB of RatAB toxin-antitoxin module